LEISPMGCRPCFELPNFFLQCLDLCRQQGDVASLVGTWWPRIMPYLSEINAHHSFAVMRQ
ncbi:MAG: hypothetical protein WA592_25175, partial [Pseudolabrys sp.]